jgi:4'-phosphopantetheinyl transferase
LRRRWGPEQQRIASVDIWSADLARAPDVAALGGLLDGSDRVALQHCRADTYTRRARARAATRVVLAQYAGVPAGSLRMASDALGKRRVRDDRCAAQLHFSVSRSGERCVVAVTRAGAIGVDLETRDAAGRDTAGLIARLAPEEIAELLQIDERQRGDAFLRCWTRKEAYVKATGTGLALGLDQCAVSTGREPRVVRSLEGDVDRWVVRDLDLDRTHVGAIAMRSGAGRVAIRERVLQW